MKSSLAASLLLVAGITVPAEAQTESLFFTSTPGTVGTHFEFANTAGAGAATQFSLFGFATHADVGDPGDPPVLHTLVIVFEWRIAPGPEHDFDHWGQSSDYITTVIGGMTNTFSTGTVVVPGAWDTVGVHFYSGFPITVSAIFDHSLAVPGCATVAPMLCGALVGARRRRP
ncbi:MAG: hypothetical protein KJZ65_07940 [Phycisphaerales bacterium]|nr:hypothetical protein [Phycisphaerales bacterium]